MTAWRDLAACAGADPGIFYPERNQGAALVIHDGMPPDAEVSAPRRAKWAIDTYCRPCPVRRECLRDEMTRGRPDRWGIRGGVWWRRNGPAVDPLGMLTTTKRRTA